jgi:hypothetical protein
MTYEEATAEAKRRWGTTGMAWYFRDAIDPYRVGFLTEGDAPVYKGHSDTSWEDAFANADDPDHIAGLI